MASPSSDTERELERAKSNLRRLALLAESFVMGECTEGGLMAQVHRALTGQDVEYGGRDE